MFQTHPSKKWTKQKREERVRNPHSLTLGSWQTCRACRFVKASSRSVHLFWPLVSLLYLFLPFQWYFQILEVESDLQFNISAFPQGSYSPHLLQRPSGWPRTSCKPQLPITIAWLSIIFQGITRHSCQDWQSWYELQRRQMLPFLNAFLCTMPSIDHSTLWSHSYSLRYSSS